MLVAKFNIQMNINVSCSVRVSNELGAAHPRTAKFSVLVVVLSSFSFGLLLSLILIIFRKQYPSLFADSAEVEKLVYDLTPLLAFCVVINNIQPALSGTCNLYVFPWYPMNYAFVMRQILIVRSLFILLFYLRIRKIMACLWATN